MKMLKQTRLWPYVVATLISLFAVQAQAQSYPTREVQIIVGVAPGGGTDYVARVLAQHLSKVWGQPVIVENRLGAAGATAAEYVAQSKPDGYTLLMASDDITSLSAFRTDLPYDLLRDLTPVSMTGTIPVVLVVNPSLPVHNIKELIALAKSEPGKLTYGSAGVGGMVHLQTSRFANTAGISLTHVPYKGTAAAVVGVVDGEIDMTFVGASGPEPGFVKSGKLRVLAISSATRSPLTPSIPTISESGLPGFSFNAWQGVFAPAGLPKDLVAKLNAAILQADNSPDLKAAFATQSGQPHPDSPSQFEKLVRDDLAMKTNVVESAGLKDKSK